jgi:predicted HTH transcriptional regulator
MLLKKEFWIVRVSIFKKTSWRELLINDVWDDCIWEFREEVKIFSEKCNKVFNFDYQGVNHELHTLDEQAFHEAFNAIVHRDYFDGMNSCKFVWRARSNYNQGHLWRCKGF